MYDKCKLYFQKYINFTLYQSMITIMPFVSTLLTVLDSFMNQEQDQFNESTATQMQDFFDEPTTTQTLPEQCELQNISIDCQIIDAVSQVIDIPRQSSQSQQSQQLEQSQQFQQCLSITDSNIVQDQFIHQLPQQIQCISSLNETRAQNISKKPLYPLEQWNQFMIQNENLAQRIQIEPLLHEGWQNSFKTQHKKTDFFQAMPLPIFFCQNQFMNGFQKTEASIIQTRHLLQKKCKNQFINQIEKSKTQVIKKKALFPRSRQNKAKKGTRKQTQKKKNDSEKRNLLPPIKKIFMELLKDCNEISLTRDDFLKQTFYSEVNQSQQPIYKPKTSKEEISELMLYRPLRQTWKNIKLDRTWEMLLFNSKAEKKVKKQAFIKIEQFLYMVENPTTN